MQYCHRITKSIGLSDNTVLNHHAHQCDQENEFLIAHKHPFASVHSMHQSISLCQCYCCDMKFILLQLLIYCLILRSWFNVHDQIYFLYEHDLYPSNPLKIA